MAKERELWQRCRTGLKNLRALGYETHVCRIENSAMSGHPDVEGCIDGLQTWIELKSQPRPVRAGTPIRCKIRDSQSIWHKARAVAGSRTHWLLIQVGAAHNAKLYLIPGSRYDDVVATESNLAAMSRCAPTATLATILLRACEPW